MIFYLLFGFFMLLIFAELIVFLFPLRFNRYRISGKDRVSILIVVRNEEQNLDRCLQSLLGQDYGNYEIWIADDSSTDSTRQIIESHLSNPTLNLFEEELQIAPSENPKAIYLEAMRHRASGDFLAVSDGDCTYHAGWLKNMLMYRGDNAIISGVTGIGNARMEDLDWMLNIGRISILSRMGFNTSAVGNNMLVEKAQLEKVGGWSTLREHITEDFALHKILFETGAGTTVAFQPGTKVISESTPLLKRFNQRKRWVRGVRNLPISVQGLLYLQPAILPLMVTGFILFKFQFLPIVLAFLFSRVIADSKLLIIMRETKFLFLIPYQIYSLLWSFSFLFYDIFGPSPKWKSRKY